MTLLEQAQALAGLVAADAMTRTEAIAMLRETYDLTDHGAGDLLDHWARHSRGTIGS